MNGFWIDAGKQVSVMGKSYWSDANTGGTSANIAPAVLELLSGLIGSPTGAAIGGHTTAAELNGITGVTNPMQGFINDPTRNNPSYPSRPKAFINYVFLDEQFRYVSGGVSPVNNTAGIKDHLTDLQNLAATKNGYLYIYCSNESPVNVFFDNLQVVHERSPLLEETHYYPFGLTMAGISSKALNGASENRLKWNGGCELANKEFSDGSGLELYETFYRSLDPQIGRFWQIDPEIEAQENFSPYESMGNNPISNVDPLGDFKTKFGAWLHRVFNGGGEIQKNEFDEWFVSKSKVEDDGNGGTVVKSWKYYGKGRDKYSSFREALLRDIEAQNDIMSHGGRIDEGGDIISTGTSMYQMYDSPEEAGKATLSYSELALPNPILGRATNAVNASRILPRGKRLSMLKDRLLKAPKPKNPKEALKLINKTLDKIEDVHAGSSDRMFGILDNKYVTYNSNGSVTALTKGHRIEIQSNGSFSIFERSTGNLFLTK